MENREFILGLVGIICFTIIISLALYAAINEDNLKHKSESKKR